MPNEQKSATAVPRKALSFAQAHQVAVTFHQQGLLRQAEQMYRTLLRAVPRHADTLHRLGALSNQLGRSGEAIDLIGRAIAIEPGSAPAHNDLGIALAAAKRPQEALAAYQKAVALEPGNVEAHNNLGTMLLGLGHADQAIAHFERALALRPNAAAAHINLGNAFAALKRFDEAIAQYRRALEIAPDAALACNNLGLAFAALGRPADALGCYEKAVTLKPNYADAYKNLARALSNANRHDAAIAPYQTALTLDPRDADMENGLGNALAVVGRHSEAVVRYAKALALRPDFAEAHNNLGNSLAALIRHEEAIGHFHKALAIAPGLLEVHNNLGSSLEALERPHEAIACYDRVLAQDANNARAHHLRGYALRSLGQLAQSRAAFERAVALAPERADFYAGIAESQRFAADDPYLPVMERLARDMAAHPLGAQIDLHFALGKVYEDVGRHEDSFRHLLAGNALKRRQLFYDEAETLGRFRRIPAVFTSELMRSRAGIGDPSTVPIFIVGMPRSGTTLVEQMLASHPKVFAAGESMEFNRAAEAFFQPGTVSLPFPEAIASAEPEQFRRLAARYLAAIRAPAPAAERITDKALGNFQFAGLIHLALPNARIVHVRRDPLDTCLSAFSKQFTNVQPHTFDLAELGRYYRGYEAVMAHWRRVLPQGVMLEVQYEELVADFEPQARRIVSHVGLAWDARCLAFHETQRTVRTASAAQVRLPLYRSAVGRARPYLSMLGPLLQALELDDQAAPAKKAEL
jgi:tetratricopeptide (TPR) repeat protein